MTEETKKTVQIKPNRSPELENYVVFFTSSLKWLKEKSIIDYGVEPKIIVGEAELPIPEPINLHGVDFYHNFGLYANSNKLVIHKNMPELQRLFAVFSQFSSLSFDGDNKGRGLEFLHKIIENYDNIIFDDEIPKLDKKLLEDVFDYSTKALEASKMSQKKAEDVKPNDDEKSDDEKKIPDELKGVKEDSWKVKKEDLMTMGKGKKPIKVVNSLDLEGEYYSLGLLPAKEKNTLKVLNGLIKDNPIEYYNTIKNSYSQIMKSKKMKKKDLLKLLDKMSEGKATDSDFKNINFELDPSKIEGFVRGGVGSFILCYLYENDSEKINEVYFLEEFESHKGSKISGRVYCVNEDHSEALTTKFNVALYNSDNQKDSVQGPLYFEGGNFEFDIPVDGKYFVVAVAEGYKSYKAMTSEFFSDKAATHFNNDKGSPAQYIEVRDGKVLNGPVEIPMVKDGSVLHKKHRFKGEVVCYISETETEIVKSGTVYVHQIVDGKLDENETDSHNLDENGKFDFEALVPNGEFIFLAKANGYMAYRKTRLHLDDLTGTHYDTPHGNPNTALPPIGNGMKTDYNIVIPMKKNPDFVVPKTKETTKVIEQEKSVEEKLPEINTLYQSILKHVSYLNKIKGKTFTAKNELDVILNHLKSIDEHIHKDKLGEFIETLLHHINDDKNNYSNDKKLAIKTVMHELNSLINAKSHIFSGSESQFSVDVKKLTGIIEGKGKMIEVVNKPEFQSAVNDLNIFWGKLNQLLNMCHLLWDDHKKEQGDARAQINDNYTDKLKERIENRQKK